MALFESNVLVTFKAWFILRFASQSWLLCSSGLWKRGADRAEV